MCCCADGNGEKKEKEKKKKKRHSETLSHRRRHHHHLHFLISLVFVPWLALGQQQILRFRQWPKEEKKNICTHTHTHDIIYLFNKAIRRNRLWDFKSFLSIAFFFLAYSSSVHTQRVFFFLSFFLIVCISFQYTYSAGFVWLLSGKRSGGLSHSHF